MKKCIIKEMVILQEAKDIKKLPKSKVRFRAKLQLLDEYSYNGKKYLRQPMIESISKKSNLIRQGGFVGEMDHPMDPSMMRILNVLYKNVSHKFQEVYVENNAVWGVVENTSNNYGLDLYAFIIKDNIPVGFSLRALGDVKDVGGGKQDVFRNIDLITWDTVSAPSYSSCIMQEIIDTTHLESYMKKTEIANLEEFVYGNNDARQTMLLESKLDKPIVKFVQHLENKYLFENNEIKIKILRNKLKSLTRKKIYSIF